MKCRILCAVMCLFMLAVLQAQGGIENFVNNGDFEDGVVEPWGMNFKPDAKGEGIMVVDDKESLTGDASLKVEINSGGDHKRAVHIIQEPLGPVEVGKKYTYSAFMKAEEARPVVMNTMKAHGGAISSPANQAFDLTEEWEEYWFTLEATADGDIRVEFELGLSDVDLWIDHVMLYEGEHVDEKLPEPQAAIKTDDMLATCWSKIKMGW